MTDAPTTLSQVLRHPLYRGAAIALFLSGLGTSAAAPQIATFLVTELHTSLTTAGLFYLTNLLAPIAGFVVGSRSDRTGHRLGLFRWCAVAGFVGWTIIAFATATWVPFVVSTLILGFAGAAASQLFAALHDALHADPAADSDGVVAVVRMALTGGWVVGPMLGSFAAAAFGLRYMLFATALCNLAQIVPLGFRRTPASSGGAAGTATTHNAAVGPAEPVTTRRASGVASERRGIPAALLVPLLAFTGLYVLVYAGESVKYAYLPLYMRDTLHFSPGLSGAIIGIQPLIELLLMPLSIVVARRMGALPLMVIGALFGVGANLLFAFSGTAAGLFGGQILMGGVWGVFAALGILVAQRLLPRAVATASAIFMSSTAVSSALGGLLGGLGAGSIGLPLVFVVPAALGVLAALGLGVLAVRRPDVSKASAAVPAPASAEAATAAPPV